MTTQENTCGFAEPQRHLGEEMLRIHHELSRIGCQSTALKAERCGAAIAFTHKKRTISLDPRKALLLLKEIPDDTDEALVWEHLAPHAEENPQEPRSLNAYHLGLCVLIVTLYLLLLILLTA